MCDGIARISIYHYYLNAHYILRSFYNTCCFSGNSVVDFTVGIIFRNISRDCNISISNAEFTLLSKTIEVL